MTTRTAHEDGYTLSEVLIAVVILAVAIVLVVGAMGSSIFSTRVHRDLVNSDAAVRQYAEQIQNGGYVQCATTASYPMVTPPAGYTMSVTSVEYWDGGSNPANYNATPPASCSSGTPTDTGVQRITLKAKPNNSSGSQTLQIVKRLP